MTNDKASPLDELPPSEQPPTDDPWVVVTPMAGPESKQGLPRVAKTRRKAFPCAVCGAYWPCEHDPKLN